jgi:hypothetical protein
MLTLAIEYSVDTPIFAFLYYRNNRHLYVDSVTEKRNTSKIINDIKKLFAVFSITVLTIKPMIHNGSEGIPFNF